MKIRGRAWPDTARGWTTRPPPRIRFIGWRREHRTASSALNEYGTRRRMSAITWSLHPRCAERGGTARIDAALVDCRDIERGGNKGSLTIRAGGALKSPSKGLQRADWVSSVGIINATTGGAERRRTRSTSGEEPTGGAPANRTELYKGRRRSANQRLVLSLKQAQGAERASPAKGSARNKRLPDPRR